MSEVHVTVGSRIGLHARPAALLAKAATQAGVAVKISRTDSGRAVDARSVLAVMGLGIGGGEEVVLSAEGPGADDALATLASLVARDLDTVSATSTEPTTTEH